MSRLAVDLSQNQGKMDFYILEDVPGIEVVYVRVGAYNYGHYIDKQFVRNVTEVMKRPQWKLGLYFPLHFYAPPQAQAEFVDTVITEVCAGAETEPFMMDVEIKPPAGKSAVDNTLEFALALGQPNPLLYTYVSYIRTYLQDVVITQFRLWIAHWNVVWPDIPWPFFKGIPYAWQHSVVNGKPYGTALAPGGYHYKIDLDTIFGG